MIDPKRELKLYYDYLLNLYFLVWVVCAYMFYQLLKAEVVIYHVRYRCNPNKIRFVAIRLLFIFSVAVVLTGVCYAVQHYSSEAKSMRES